MGQNPYANFGAGSDFLESTERRTSVLAIVALVLALLCFIPGFGLLAMILGGASLLFISQSRGRLGGLGLAITACVVGLIVTVIQGAIFYGMAQVSSAATTHFTKPVGTVFTGVANLDYKAARSLLTPRASSVITDAEIAAFSKAVKDELGAYAGPPEGMFGLVGSYGQVGPLMQKFQGRNDVVPFPGNFAKGTALIVLQADQRHTGQPSGLPGEESIPLLNYGVVTMQGKEIWLVEPDEMRDRLQAAKPAPGDAEKAGGNAPDAPKVPTPPKP